MNYESGKRREGGELPPQHIEASDLGEALNAMWARPELANTTDALQRPRAYFYDFDGNLLGITHMIQSVSSRELDGREYEYCKDVFDLSITSNTGDYFIVRLHQGAMPEVGVHEMTATGNFPDEGPTDDQEFLATQVAEAIRLLREGIYVSEEDMRNATFYNRDDRHPDENE